MLIDAETQWRENGVILVKLNLFEKKKKETIEGCYAWLIDLVRYT